MASTLEAVDALAAENVPRFYASAVASRLGRDASEVANELGPLVERGELTVRFDLVCDTCGVTVRSYGPGDVIEGGEEECFGTDEPHSVEVRRENIWVSYAPTEALRARARTRPTLPGQKVAHRKRSRPWAWMLGALLLELRQIPLRRSALRTSTKCTSTNTSSKARAAWWKTARSHRRATSR